jgi:hypothetical protein
MRRDTAPETCCAAMRAWYSVRASIRSLHGPGARKVQAAVQEGAQRELAGLGQPRARPAGALQAIAQHDGRAVAADLDTSSAV